MKMKAIIIDDDQTVVSQLSEKLSRLGDIEVVGTAADGTSGLKLVLQKKPDLLFLDIELPDINGLDFIDRMDEADFWCFIIIFTAFEQYMLPAFRNNAFDYLLKPVGDEELLTVINRVRNERARPRRLSGNSVVRQMDDSLLFYLNTVDFQLVKIQDIGVCQYNHNLRVWEVVVAGQSNPIRLKRNVTNETLLALDQRLVQVNQKYIINITCLMKVKDNICHFYPPFDHIDYVKVGRFFRRKFIERFKTL